MGAMSESAALGGNTNGRKNPDTSGQARIVPGQQQDPRTAPDKLIVHAAVPVALRRGGARLGWRTRRRLALVCGDVERDGGPMTTPSRFVNHGFPYDDEEAPMPELIAGGQCVEDECNRHGISLHPAHHEPRRPKLGAPTDIAEDAVALVEDCGPYGSGP
jgi:hypothetical protein